MGGGGGGGGDRGHGNGMSQAKKQSQHDDFLLMLCEQLVSPVAIAQQFLVTMATRT